MHCLLLGNGLNRLSSQLTWIQLLQCLAKEYPDSELANHLDQKPLSLFFEELCARSEGNFRQAESTVKKNIASLLKELPHDSLHVDFANLFKVILTTNYDYTLEKAMVGPFFNPAPLMPETRYSLFRRVLVGNNKEIWHIHGDVNITETILLGYDHYAGYLQKIRNYLTVGLKPGDKTNIIRSPLKSGTHDFEQWERLHSWVDYFLRDHLHIVGLGLDFTEIDLWWLLLHKRRRDIKTGLTFYYQIRIIGAVEQNDTPQMSILKSLGMQVICVDAENYREGYKLILDKVAHNIETHTELLARN